MALRASADRPATRRSLPRRRLFDRQLEVTSSWIESIAMQPLAIRSARKDGHQKREKPARALANRSSRNGERSAAGRCQFDRLAAKAPARRANATDIAS